jgi:FMN reductase
MSARLLAVVGSADGGSTSAVVGEVLAGAHELGATSHVIHLGRGGYEPELVPDALAEAGDFDAVVLGTPTYRATYAGVLKSFLDGVPRAQPVDGYASPFLGKPIAVVGTGRSAHHFLGVDPLIDLLVRFFAAYVVPPALYGQSHEIGDSGGIESDELRAAARSLGATTARLAELVVSTPELAGRRPQF